jgi:iron complex transport system permease protein
MASDAEGGRNRRSTSVSESTVERQRGRGVRARILAFAAASLVVVVAIVLAACMGGATLTPGDALRALLAGLFSDVNAVGGDAELARHVLIVRDLRLPRIILMALLGAALAPAGAAYQGLFRNPLAEPYVIGVASGAGLGATLILRVPGIDGAVGHFAVPAAAFAGGAMAVVLVVAIARGATGLASTRLILAGVAVGSLATAMTTFVLTGSPGGIQRVFQWLHGGYIGGGWLPVIVTLPYVIVGNIGLAACAHRLNVLALDDEQARELGVHVESVKLATLAFATLMTGASVAFGGLLGFVGLVVPHVFRLLGFRDHRSLLPLSALGGATFLIAADWISRTLVAPREIPVGVVTAFVGGPFFIFLLLRGGRRSSE